MIAVLRKVLTGAWVGLVGLAVVGTALIAVSGWRLEVVTSSSMEPEIPKRSLAVVEPAELGDVSVGDVIAFRGGNDPDRVVMHRITGLMAVDGSTAFRTQGDANQTPDVAPVTADQLVGQVRWHLPALGSIAWALRPPWGTVALVGIPAVALMASELRRWGRRKRATALAGFIVASDGTCTARA